ncbi:hypothetical protein [Embleya sp. NPDC020630]|uniref:hypothetical protein n=1 Tax=Embleya sp. NPDC020630 TaxID=3363979 RepID=UPI00378A31B6
MRRTPPAPLNPYGPPNHGAPYPPMPLHPSAPPPRAGGGGGRWMMVLTLVGTVATVVSVLIAMNIGPFDFSDKGTAVNRASYLKDINRTCADSYDNIADKLNDVDVAASTETTDVAALQQRFRALDLSLRALMDKLDGLPKPGRVDADVKAWWDLYQRQAAYVATMTEQFDNGDVEAASATIEENTRLTAGGGPLDLAAKAIGVKCP